MAAHLTRIRELRDRLGVIEALGAAVGPDQEPGTGRIL
jgi:hypothetical protein